MNNISYRGNSLLNKKTELISKCRLIKSKAAKLQNVYVLEEILNTSFSMSLQNLLQCISVYM